MKLKEGFVIREIAGQTVAVPTMGDLDLDMMITLNGTGAFLWQQLQKETSEEQLVAALLAEYNVDESTARKSVAVFVEKLKGNGFIE